MERTANAVWTGGLKDGNGKVSTGSGGLKDASYSFATRFENGGGTDPEELIAAAHSACFSMAFSAELGKAGLNPERIETTATVTLGKTEAGPTITKSHLSTSVKVPGATEEQVREIANGAKAGCPISRLLNAEITLELTVLA